MMKSRLYLIIGVILMFISIGLFWGQGYYWDLPTMIATSFTIAGSLVIAASMNNWK